MKPDFRKTIFLILMGASILVVAIFLVFSASSGYWGFPLDDAWIHQVYARNLVQRGEWSFNPGQPSGGSTSPLWSVLLAGAYLLKISPIIWSGFLGLLSLFGIALFAELILRRWVPAYSGLLPWVGLFFIFEWHLIWASVSGMETVVYICLILAVFFFLGQGKEKSWLAGLLIGLSVWVRPDGITLLGPALLLVVCRKQRWHSTARDLATILAIFLCLFAPYLLFNYQLAGSPWPSTFSAKQAEYSASTTLPIFTRLGSLILPFLAGGGVILLPGIIAAAICIWKEKKVEQAGVFLWFTGYLVLYAVRLPVNYQHGRYMMPAMAGFFLIGLWGVITLVNQWGKNRRANLSRMFWLSALAAVTLTFFVMGLAAFRTDVGIIETEMVQTARWLRDNTPAGSRLAVHDIGAIGYFSNRDVVDLAGLVNPEVIPIMRDEDQLAAYLNRKDVDYLVTFPAWYPKMTSHARQVYQTGGKISPLSGGENMTVYAWKK
ncbi:hypothetical protein [Leptolinea tardivitalis]|uniref:Glycosyltransferase RgtA/B/C/D-like domain-containing protein n=1 Tax=Leptolinea tardivitalis TaxID=229920 RepID=A0A0P6XT95_9CHLR|nr:hypothetical protein [Leptolinea tardivitalis]KPL72716.1 hypothetical protein ADM99_06450 [Leptolinea tardivitalis]GAP20939.1 hypothetical protein LTAR_01140 [Leptolinea tardivitalis]